MISCHQSPFFITHILILHLNPLIISYSRNSFGKKEDNRSNLNLLNLCTMPLCITIQDKSNQFFLFAAFSHIYFHDLFASSSSEPANIFHRYDFQYTDMSDP